MSQQGVPQPPTIYGDSLFTAVTTNKFEANSVLVDSFVFDNVTTDTLTLGSTNPSTALITDASNNVASSTTTSTELSYVHGVTSSIQTQLDSKLSALNITGVTNQINVIDMSGDILLAIASNPTIPGTGSMQWPSGTTAERAGLAGSTRFNTTTSQFEGTPDGLTWEAFEAGTGVTNVTATAPITSTGGFTPNIALTTPLAVTYGGTGTSTAFTSGSVVFAGTGGTYNQDNANFSYNSSTHTLTTNALASTTATVTTGNITTVNATTGNITTVDATTVDTTNANVDSTLIVGSASNSEWFEGAKLVYGINGLSQGFSCSLYGDYAIVGGANTSSNSALIYQNTNGIWSLVTRLTQTGGIAFGQAVSIVSSGSTQTAIVGASQDNTQIGSVYVYQNTGSGWTQITVLTPSDNIGTSFFGTSVKLVVNGSTYTAIIGGSDDNSGVGAAWIYQSTTGGGSGWTEITKLIPPDNIGNSAFGNSVSLVVNGTTYTAAIGGLADNSGVGAVWIYQSTTGGGSGWTEITKLIPSDGINISTFGSSVDITQNSNVYDTVIGGFQDNSNIGAAWIYQSTGGGSGWSEIVKLVPTDYIGPVAYFGYSVSISGSYVLIGGYADNTFHGAGWIYKNISSVWTEVTKLIPVNGISPYSYVGTSCSIDGTTLIIGGYNDDYSVGAAWIYDYLTEEITVENADITTPGIITAGILTDGYATMSGGSVVANVLSDGTFSTISGKLFNANITDVSNNVTATSLATNSANPVTINSTTPSTGQVLKATSSTVATWQTLFPITTASSSNFTTVTMDCGQGLLTITAVTLTTSSLANVTINNLNVTASSVIMLSVVSNATTSCFVANAVSIGTGSFKVVVCNVGANVSNVSIQIAFMLLN